MSGGIVVDSGGNAQQDYSVVFSKPIGDDAVGPHQWAIRIGVAPTAPNVSFEVQGVCVHQG